MTNVTSKTKVFRRFCYFLAKPTITTRFHQWLQENIFDTKIASTTIFPKQCSLLSQLIIFRIVIVSISKQHGLLVRNFNSLFKFELDFVEKSEPKKKKIPSVLHREFPFCLQTSSHVSQLLYVKTHLLITRAVSQVLTRLDSS